MQLQLENVPDIIPRETDIKNRDLMTAERAGNSSSNECGSDVVQTSLRFGFGQSPQDFEDRRGFDLVGSDTQSVFESDATIHNVLGLPERRKCSKAISRFLVTL